MCRTCGILAFMARVIKRPTIDRLSQKFGDLKSLSTAQLGERWMTFLVADAHSLAWPPLQARFGVNSPTRRNAGGEMAVVSC